MAVVSYCADLLLMQYSIFPHGMAIYMISFLPSYSVGRNTLSINMIILVFLLFLSLTSLFYGEQSEKEKSPSESSPSDSETKDLVSPTVIMDPTPDRRIGLGV